MLQCAVDVYFETSDIILNCMTTLQCLLFVLSTLSPFSARGTTKRNWKHAERNIQGLFIALLIWLSCGPSSHFVKRWKYNIAVKLDWSIFGVGVFFNKWRNVLEIDQIVTTGFSKARFCLLRTWTFCIAFKALASIMFCLAVRAIRGVKIFGKYVRLE